ncbi:MAG: HipA N-terminal domain-containing protein [Oscillospiraceae bacterium]|nr:HipA N-terminal domain-containing protein [Oscillospiraceae bacterium]
MENYKALEVRIGAQQVGTLALYKGRFAAFEYEDSWLQSGFSISPFSLPLQKKLYIPRFDPFEGIYGVFADSLPDGWGRLLVDRVLLRKQIDPYGVDTLNRLAIVGDSGMGALSYFPRHEMHANETKMEMGMILLWKICFT